MFTWRSRLVLGLDKPVAGVRRRSETMLLPWPLRFIQTFEVSMSDLPGDEEYDDEDTTQRAADAFEGVDFPIPTGPVGAGGGPTIRAVTLGALSVPVPKHVQIREMEPPRPKFPWSAILLGIALGVGTTLAVGTLALNALGLIHLF